jgi:hypothetical protein
MIILFSISSLFLNLIFIFVIFYLILDLHLMCSDTFLLACVL